MKTAVEYYQAPGHPYNCAQAVALGAGYENLVDELKCCGGGRAEGGICGALHTALLLSNPQQHEQIKAEFCRQAGALTCREIKGAAATPCSACVEIAAALLAEASKR
jgi:hypothetical protein